MQCQRFFQSLRIGFFVDVVRLLALGDSLVKHIDAHVVSKRLQPSLRRRLKAVYLAGFRSRAKTCDDGLDFRTDGKLVFNSFLLAATDLEQVAAHWHQTWSCEG